MAFLYAEVETFLVTPDLPPIETGNLSREQILGLAAREMQQLEYEHQQYTRRQASGASKVLIVCGVAILALLIFLCGYIVGQYTSGFSPLSSDPAKIRETLKP